MFAARQNAEYKIENRDEMITAPYKSSKLAQVKIMYTSIFLVKNTDPSEKSQHCVAN